MPEATCCALDSGSRLLATLYHGRRLGGRRILHASQCEHDHVPRWWLAALNEPHAPQQTGFLGAAPGFRTLVPGPCCREMSRMGLIWSPGPLQTKRFLPPVAEKEGRRPSGRNGRCGKESEALLV